MLPGITDAGGEQLAGLQRSHLRTADLTVGAIGIGKERRAEPTGRVAVVDPHGSNPFGSVGKRLTGAIYSIEREGIKLSPHPGERAGQGQALGRLPAGFQLRPLAAGGSGISNEGINAGKATRHIDRNLLIVDPRIKQRGIDLEGLGDGKPGKELHIP